jgi:hypothetical protein
MLTKSARSYTATGGGGANSHRDLDSTRLNIKTQHLPRQEAFDDQPRDQHRR